MDLAIDHRALRPHCRLYTHRHAGPQGGVPISVDPTGVRRHQVAGHCRQRLNEVPAIDIPPQGLNSVPALKLVTYYRRVLATPVGASQWLVEQLPDRQAAPLGGVRNDHP